MSKKPRELHSISSHLQVALQQFIENKMEKQLLHRQESSVCSEQADGPRLLKYWLRGVVDFISVIEELLGYEGDPIVNKKSIVITGLSSATYPHVEDADI